MLMETICMKHQTHLLEKMKKTISKCHLLKFLPRVLSFNLQSAEYTQ